MEQQFRVLSFLIDGLVSIEQPFPDRFTLIARLLIQLLPDIFFARLSNAAGESMPAADNDGLLAMRKEIETIMKTFKAGRDAAGEDTAKIRACAEDASEALLQVIETYILTLIIPEDWQIVWMGVEG